MTSSMGTSADDDFIYEALLLSTLCHNNVVQLIGVSMSRYPFYLVTASQSSFGRLNEFLSNRRHTQHVRSNPSSPVSEPSDHNDSPVICVDNIADCGLYHAICRQATEALIYLEQQRFVVHRNISTRSFEVFSSVPVNRMSSEGKAGDGADAIQVKLTDFGRARSVIDDEYIGDQSEKVFVKWAAPEVLMCMRYSSKSDVWALAVVFWEVFTDDDIQPYDRLSPEQTAVYVCHGGSLNRPRSCSVQLFRLMRRCWNRKSVDRPSASEVGDLLHSGVGLRHINYTFPSANHGDLPLPPVARAIHRDRLTYLKTSQSFTASESLTSPPIILTTSPSISQSFLSHNNNLSSSSPPLPRSRRRNNATTMSFPSPLSNFRSRTSTPPAHRKLHCSTANNKQPTSTQCFNEQRSLLVVPGTGNKKTSSKSSLSSRESTVNGGGLVNCENNGFARCKDSERTTAITRRRKTDSKRKTARQSITSLLHLMDRYKNKDSDISG